MPEHWPHQDTRPEWWTQGQALAQLQLGPQLGPQLGQRLQVWEQQQHLGLALLLACLLWSLKWKRLLSLRGLLSGGLVLGRLLRVCLQLVLAQAHLLLPMVLGQVQVQILLGQVLEQPQLEPVLAPLHSHSHNVQAHMSS